MLSNCSNTEKYLMHDLLHPESKKLSEKIQILKFQWMCSNVFDKKRNFIASNHDKYKIRYSEFAVMMKNRLTNELSCPGPKKRMCLCHGASIHFISHLKSKMSYRNGKLLFYIFNLKIIRVIKIKMTWWEEHYFFHQNAH